MGPSAKAEEHPRGHQSPRHIQAREGELLADTCCFNGRCLASSHNDAENLTGRRALVDADWS
jgi:hypothetical protein